MSLSAWRKKTGATLAGVAAGVGTSRSHIWNIETGKKRPSPELATKIEVFTRGAVSAAGLVGLAERSRHRSGVQEDAVEFDAGSRLTIEVAVSEDQTRLLEKQGVNISSVARAGAEKAIKEAAARAWAEANREAIEASNRWIEKHGTLAEQLGLV